MTPEQQRIKIAQACDYRPDPDTGLWYMLGDTHLAGFNGKAQRIEPLPDYLNDLNAMAEAEKHLSMLQEDKYSKWLWVVVTDTPIPSTDPWDVVKDRDYPTFCIDTANAFRSATAAQRAKAFLLTLDPYSFHSTGEPSNHVG